MAKRNVEKTSSRAASAAAKTLRNPKSGKIAKSAAASALTKRLKRSQGTDEVLRESTERYSEALERLAKR